MNSNAPNAMIARIKLPSRLIAWKSHSPLGAQITNRNSNDFKNRSDLISQSASRIATRIASKSKKDPLGWISMCWLSWFSGPGCCSCPSFHLRLGASDCSPLLAFCFMGHWTFAFRAKTGLTAHVFMLEKAVAVSGVCSGVLEENSRKVPGKLLENFSWIAKCYKF